MFCVAGLSGTVPGSVLLESALKKFIVFLNKLPLVVDMSTADSNKKLQLIRETGLLSYFNYVFLTG